MYKHPKYEFLSRVAKHNITWSMESWERGDPKQATVFLIAARRVLEDMENEIVPIQWEER